MNAALAVLLLLAAGAAPAPEPSPQAARWGSIILPSGTLLRVELADTPALRARGLMFREKVPPGEGMLFFMEGVDFHAFWMKNCRTALDILWLDEQWRVVHLAPEVPPCTGDPCPLYFPMQAARYTLEVGPGEAVRLGLKIGARLSYLPPEPR